MRARAGVVGPVDLLGISYHDIGDGGLFLFTLFFPFHFNITITRVSAFCLKKGMMQ